MKTLLPTQRNTKLWTKHLEEVEGEKKQLEILEMKNTAIDIKRKTLNRQD